MLVGWVQPNSDLNGWIYKLSSTEDYQWQLEFIYSFNSYMLSANQVENGDIVAVISTASEFMWTITLDTEGNTIDITRDSVKAYIALDGIVERNGAVGVANSNYIITKMKCAAGTYKSSDSLFCLQCPPMTYQDKEEQSSCIDCSEGTYQDDEGQISCKPCVHPCKSCSTAINCSECFGLFFVDTLDSLESRCVESCRTGYFANEATRSCDGTLLLRSSLPRKLCSLPNL